MEPKNPALRALLAATVRVGEGSGVVVRGDRSEVVITAAHVLGDDGPPRVWTQGRLFEANVLHSDDALDLAVLAIPALLEAAALPLLDQEHVTVGEELWATGFPGGWRVEAGPVLCKGTVAGIDLENWINLDATWGNSGGALARVASRKASLAGITLGGAGEVHELFETFRRALARMSDSHAETLSRDSEHMARTESHRRKINEHLSALKVALSRLEGERAVVWGQLISNAETVQEILEMLAQTSSSTIRSTDISLKMAQELLYQIEQHFRTGFVRFAGVNAIRKVLGLGG